MLNEEIPLMVARQRAEYQTVYSVMEASITPPKPKIPPVRAKPKVDQAEESTVMPLKVSDFGLGGHLVFVWGFVY